MKADYLHWWNNLRHGGLLLDLQRLSKLLSSMPSAMPEWQQDRLRREVIAFQNTPDEKRSAFVAFVLADVCGFSGEHGEWHRGSNISSVWTRHGLTGESLRPNHLWLSRHGSVLPVFLDSEKRIGIGRGKRITARCLQWLRQGDEQLALVTNGHQWRIIFAGLDYDAWAEWELEQWQAEGRFSDEFDAFRALISPSLWMAPEKGQTCPLLTAINDSRKGQSDLSKILGERVRQAAELLIDGHAPALNLCRDQLDPQDIYRAAVRVIMRMVVILFAESREGLLPRDNPVFNSAYSLQGLRELLDRGGQSRHVANCSAWPRILALFRLIYQGSDHEAMPVPKYGGELFAPGCAKGSDGMKRAIYVFENACFEQDVMNDALVRQLLDMLTRTRVTIRQGRSSSWMMAPVDFSSLDSEYIGILYEGLLDFELRCGVDGQPIVFLAVGNQPALPLATLEAMNDKAIRNLFEKLKDTSSKDDDEEEEMDDGQWSVDDEESEDEDVEEEDGDSWMVDGEESDGSEGPSSPDTDHQPPATEDDPRYTLRARAEQWAQHAVEVAKLVKKPRGKLTPEKRMAWERELASKARQLITKVVLPGEWYLVRWGGTRKGSGTFYTRPQLAIPTVYRTLEPLCYEVLSGQGPVAGEEKEMKGDCPESRGPGSVAEGNGPRDARVQADSVISESRDLRADESTSTSSGISAFEHRGGPGTQVNKGVSQPPLDGEGIPHGSGDPDSHRVETEISETGKARASEGADTGHGAPAQRFNSSSATQAVASSSSSPATDHRQPATRLPKLPEQILALKICDPACGSGSFPLAALRYLTNALYDSLIVHNRIQDRGDQAVLELIYNEDGRELLADEKLPCRLEDDDFELRTKAVLRRYVVERCIYGVDLDPLAVELCRLSLWIETLDPNLPLTFLNHKIKCGNSLVGAWFDQFLHYPAMAWDREGGDKNHSNGVHFRKEAWTKAIKKKMNVVKAELKNYIDGGTLFFPVNLDTVRTEHDAAAEALREIHAYGITQVQERAERYEALISDPDFIRLKEAFDLWCALWFWPPDHLDLAPLPLAFAAGELSDEARAIARRVAAERRFFHWELEFPDVFHAAGQGFDAILGNPPWETLQPVSKEFFSAIDPMYRSYGKQEALGRQKELFLEDESAELSWLEYNAFFKAMANWSAYAGHPFGDRLTRGSNDRERHDLNLGDRGRSSFETSGQRHARWKQKREEITGYTDPEHVFQHQGTGKAYTYKMFLEQAHALLRSGGRLGLIVPSGLYSDHGTRALRRLFLDDCSWEWIFGFENREGIFEIHRSFKFNPVIVAKGGSTQAIRTAFMRRDLADWEHGEDFATLYPRERIVQFSPNSLAILEIQSPRDLEVLTKIYANSVLLGDQGPDGWGIKYTQGDFNMTSDSKLFPPRTKWEEWGYRPDEYSRWIKGPWKPVSELWKELGVASGESPVGNGQAKGDSGDDKDRVIPGSEGLAGVDDFGGGGLSGNGGIPEGGAVRADEPDAAGGSVHSLQHRGGVGARLDAGLRSLSPDRAGQSQGTGDPGDSVRAAGVDDQGTGAGHRGAGGEHWPDAGCPGTQPPTQDQLATPPLPTGPSPLPTGHSPLPRLRCAQPPYDRLPIPRADIPEGIILSREATHYLHEDEIPIVTFTEANGKPLKIKVQNEEGKKEEVVVKGPAVALPLYQGVMIWQLNSCVSDYLKGATHSARWERRSQYEEFLPEPQFAMGHAVAKFSTPGSVSSRIAYRAVQNATNQRTMICSLLPQAPAGNSLGVIHPGKIAGMTLPIFMNDFAYDYALRPRMSQANLNWFILEETPVPNHKLIDGIYSIAMKLTIGMSICNVVSSILWLTLPKCKLEGHWRSLWAATEHERIRLRCVGDAISLSVRGLEIQDVARMIKDCDHSLEAMQNSKFASTLYVKGFWRVDKDKLPEHRHTVLTLVAFDDLQEKIAACGGDVDKGIEAFCAQNDGEGWMLPETLRLADYGLGHDDRAKEHQPVRECFGPRFYDWQLAQSPEESWRECHLHARNLLGKGGYEALLAELAGETTPQAATAKTPTTSSPNTKPPASHDAYGQLHLGGRGFDEDIPLLQEKDEDVREEQ